MIGSAHGSDGEMNAPPPASVGAGAPLRHGFGPFGSGLVSVLLFASLFFLPFVGMIVAPLGVIPVLHLAGRGEPGIRAWGWVAALLAALAVAGGGVRALLVLGGYALVVIVPSVSAELWRRKRWSEGRWAALSVLGVTALAMAALAALAWPASPLEASATWLRTAGDYALELYRTAGVAGGDLQLALDATERTMAWLLPSLPIAYLTAILFWIRPRLLLLGFEVPAGEFEAYRSDEWLPAVFAAGGLGTVLLSGTPRWVAVNILAASLILFFVHGLAIIRAHLARFVGRGWLVRWVVALFCLQVPLPLFVAILGIVDNFRDVRPRPQADDRRQE